MEAIRKQASKLREQVAKQQQALLRQLGHISSATPLVDETELQCYQQLRNLYNSTKTTKNFQRNIVRGIEGLISISSKQMDIVRKLADDCCKYGTENQASGYPLAEAAIHCGDSYRSMEKERESLLGILANEVSEPLRAQITGAPLEDARHLTHQYDKLCQEVEAQAAEVLRRQSKLRDSSVSAESSMKLQNAESRLKELKSAMVALGREATAAMLAVEDQQQQITFQKIRTMVDAERCYHQNVLDILENLYVEMIQQLEEPTLHHVDQEVSGQPPPQVSNSNGIDEQGHVNKADTYFIGKVIHPFDAQSEGELNLAVDDYVVVRQVAPTGWSEGECKGNAGWFPSAYVERQDKVPVSKMTD